MGLTGDCQGDRPCITRGHGGELHAQLRHAGDGVQRALRSRCPPRLMRSVRPLGDDKTNTQVFIGVRL
jgi:hypothetical protein